MNMSRDEGYTLVREILDGLKETDIDTEVVLAPPFPYLTPFAKMLTDIDRIHLSAQNCSQHDNGAYTGEISAQMLASFKVSHVIIGHSERRQYFDETDELIAGKITKALEHGLVAIYCFGETLEQRKAGQHKVVVTRQIRSALLGLGREHMSNLVLAYEPVWAIGTGETATPEQAQDIHRHVRELMTELFGSDGQNVSILYGGSCKPNNAHELFSQPDIDGGLIGGASLKAEDFLAIIKSYSH